MSEVLFVANHEFDCVGAKAAGMRTVFIDRRRRPFAAWPHQPDLVVESMTRLAMPWSEQAGPSPPAGVRAKFAAGGPVDTLARIVAERMRTSLSQPVVIENVTGAGGSIGTGRVARAVPDGYTLVIGIWTTHVVNGAIYALQYDVLPEGAP